jgi:hypothetical protein
MPLGRSPRRGQLVLSQKSMYYFGWHFIVGYFMGYNGIRWGIQIFTNDMIFGVVQKLRVYPSNWEVAWLDQ